MKRVLGACIVLAVVASPSLAVQPFFDAFQEKYGPPGSKLENVIATTKCNICHIDKKPKKERNPYGQIVSKYLKKVDFVGTKKKFDPKTEEGKKAITDGLQQANAEKSDNGQTFEQILVGGNLPFQP